MKTKCPKFFCATLIGMLCLPLVTQAQSQPGGDPRLDYYRCARSCMEKFMQTNAEIVADAQQNEQNRLSCEAQAEQVFENDKLECEAKRENPGANPGFNYAACMQSAGQDRQTSLEYCAKSYAEANDALRDRMKEASKAYDECIKKCKEGGSCQPADGTSGGQCKPTPVPTVEPTVAPTVTPTQQPTANPTVSPTPASSDPKPVPTGNGLPGILQKIKKLRIPGVPGF